MPDEQKIKQAEQQGQSEAIGRIIKQLSHLITKWRSETKMSDRRELYDHMVDFINSYSKQKKKMKYLKP